MGLSPAAWDALSWDIQRAYLEGLAEDDSVPFSWKEEPAEMTPGVSGPVIRENVDAGTDVIDLAAMRAELEADRARRHGSHV